MKKGDNRGKMTQSPDAWKEVGRREEVESSRKMKKVGESNSR